MKHNWKYKKLGEVCSVIGGSTPRTDVPEYWVGDINWFTPAEINDQKYYFSSERKISKVAVTSSGLTLLPQGTVLLTSRAPIGKVGILCQEGYCNQGFKNLVCKEELYNEYLYYTLIYFKKEIEEKGRGATFKEISKKVTESIEIPVPPMEVQVRIAAELDKLNEVIATKRDQIKQLDLLAQSIFYDTFGDPVTNPKGWIVSKLHYECLEITDGDHAAPPKSNEGIPFITISNIDKERYIIDFTDSYYVPRTYFESIKSNRKPQKGDVLYTVTGSYGITVEVKDNLEFCFQRHIGLLRPGNNLNSTFLAYWGRSEGMKFVADKVATGIAQKTVSLSSLRDFPLILPPLSLQQQFAMRVEAIEKQKAQIEESIKELQILLDSRMDYWFN